MNKALIAMSFLTACFIVATFVVAFSNFSISRQVAAVVTSVEALFARDVSPSKFAQGALAYSPYFSEEDKQLLFEHANSLTASTTPEQEQEDEEEPPIEVDDWKIFYSKSNFGGAHAYTLRYPPDWVINDSRERTKILMYEAEGFIYSLSLYEEPFSIASRGRFSVATSTTFGDTEFIKKSAIQAGTTTLVAYTPTGNPKSFNTAFGTVPPGASAEYIKIYERILSTLAVEPADYPFTISKLQVALGGPLLTTETAIAEPFLVAWEVKELEEINKDNAELNLWIENTDGEVVYQLQSPRSYSAKSAKFTLPRNANEELTFGQRYRVVALGEANGKKTNKVYSNWFTIFDSVQFTDARLITTPSKGVSPLKVSVEASIKNSADPNYRYIVFFEEGAYSVLDKGDAKKYWGEWRHTFNSSKTIYLMRTTLEALNNRLYGARTYSEVSQFADEILSASILVE